MTVDRARPSVCGYGKSKVKELVTSARELPCRAWHAAGFKSIEQAEDTDRDLRLVATTKATGHK